jgi:molybdenum cofactor cytidylyltransferase
MGQPKQLLPLGDKTVIRHCVDNIVSALIRRIVVVVRPDAEEMVEALSGLPVSIVVNHDRDSDMAGSVQVGLQSLDPSSLAVLVCLADHPLASAETMKTLMRAHQESPDKIIIPAYNGKRGHPSLFPASVLKEIFSGSTLRDIVRGDEKRVRVIDVPDEGIVFDMDTPDDYERVLKRAGVVQRLN